MGSCIRSTVPLFYCSTALFAEANWGTRIRTYFRGIGHALRLRCNYPSRQLLARNCIAIILEKHWACIANIAPNLPPKDAYPECAARLQLECVLPTRCPMFQGFGCRRRSFLKASSAAEILFSSEPEPVGSLRICPESLSTRIGQFPISRFDRSLSISHPFEL
jgi:hypothetical protein